jgi:ribosomal protein S18 acetylase RimI-like enzyme
MVSRDIPACLEFNEALGWDEKRFYRAIYDEDKSSDMLEIDVAGSFVKIGFVIWRSLGHKVEILNFCVKPEFRGHGYGRLLIGRVLSKTNPEQKRVSFVADERNDQLIKFLVSCGFKGGCVIKSAYGKGLDGWTFFLKKPRFLIENLLRCSNSMHLALHQ